VSGWQIPAAFAVLLPVGLLSLVLSGRLPSPALGELVAAVLVESVLVLCAADLRSLSRWEDSS
jgi:CHASE2 domain-containing sensor protein